MMSWLVGVACVGIEPLRRGALPSAERAAALKWLGRVALRWGRGGWWALLGLVLVPLVAVLLGTVAAVPVYCLAFIQRWPGHLRSLADVWMDVNAAPDGAYRLAMHVHAGLTLSAVLPGFLLWARMGAQTALARRGQCAQCRHTLTGLPVLEAAEHGSPGPRSVRCPECAAVHAVLPAWGEVNIATRCFEPAIGLVRPFWTRRRVKMARWLAVGVVALVGAVWAGQWVWSHIDARRQAAAAVAARLSPEELARRVYEARVAAGYKGVASAAGPGAPGVSPSREELIRRLAPQVQTLMDAFNADPETGASKVGLRIVHEHHIAPFWHLQQDVNRAAIETVAERLLERLLADGVERALDEIAAAPHDSRGLLKPDGVWLLPSGYERPPLDKIMGVNLALLRVAARAGDLTGVARRLATAEAVLEVGRDGAIVFDGYVHARLIQYLMAHIDWAARLPNGAAEGIRESGAWFDLLESAADRVSAPDLALLLAADRIGMLDSVADHFSDPARVRRGMDDPYFAPPPMSPINRHDGPRTRLGDFQENVSALNEWFDTLMQLARESRWTPDRYGAASRDRSGLGLLESMGYSSVLQRNDSAVLSIQSVRIVVRIERFIALSPEGRPPTREELLVVLGPDVDFTDPFTGKPLGYRVVDPAAAAPPTWPAHWPRRPYVLYSAGLDGVDHGGKVQGRELWTDGSEIIPGADLILPDCVLIP